MKSGVNEELHLVDGPGVHLAVVLLDMSLIEVLAAGARGFVEQPARSTNWLVGRRHGRIMPRVPSGHWRLALRRSPAPSVNDAHHRTLRSIPPAQRRDRRNSSAVDRSRRLRQTIALSGHYHWRERMIERRHERTTARVGAPGNDGRGDSAAVVPDLPLAGSPPTKSGAVALFVQGSRETTSVPGAVRSRWRVRRTRQHSEDGRRWRRHRVRSGRGAGSG